MGNVIGTPIIFLRIFFHFYFCFIDTHEYAKQTIAYQHIEKKNYACLVPCSLVMDKVLFRYESFYRYIPYI